MVNKVRRYYSLLRGVFGVRQLKKTKRKSLGSILNKQAEKLQAKPLILFENKIITYEQFNQKANKYANLFLSLKFKKGDTVALLMENRPEYLIIHAGLAKIGVIPALVNTNIREKPLAHAINIAHARALIIGHEFIEPIKNIRSKVKLPKPGIVFMENGGLDIKTPKWMIDVNILLKNCRTESPVLNYSIGTDDILEYIYTSGTTGLPKATKLTHHKWIQLGLGGGYFCLRAISDDVQYCCLPLYHNSGINVAWATTLISGGTFALRRKFSASTFWDDVRRYNATLFVYIGELCRYLNNQPAKPDDGNNPLEYLLGTGMRGDYWEEFQKRFKIKKIVEVYGMTEGVGALTNVKGAPGMIGRLSTAGFRMGEVAQYDIENNRLIRNKKGFVEKCKPGEKGMFLAKISKISPFSGYKNNRDETNKKIIRDVFKPNDIYFITGDLFKLHKRDWVSFDDRLGDTFRWKGEVVSTNEVSDVLNRFGFVEDCNVYGVRVENTEGRAGMAALTLVNGSEIDWNKFSSYVIKNLPAYARPSFIRLTQQKEITSTFKQIKTRLQDDGFNPSKIDDQIYFLDPAKNIYIKLTTQIYKNIMRGKIRF